VVWFGKNILKKTKFGQSGRIYYFLSFSQDFLRARKNKKVKSKIYIEIDV